MNSISLVKFSDGTWGVRRWGFPFGTWGVRRWGFPFPEYRDFETRDFWWPRNHEYFNCCSTSEEVARAYFDNEKLKDIQKRAKRKNQVKVLEIVDTYPPTILMRIVNFLQKKSNG